MGVNVRSAHRLKRKKILVCPICDKYKSIYIEEANICQTCRKNSRSNYYIPESTMVETKQTPMIWFDIVDASLLCVMIYVYYVFIKWAFFSS